MSSNIGDNPVPLRPGSPGPGAWHAADRTAPRRWSTRLASGGHTVSIASITFDSTDPERLAGWWAGRFDATITVNMDGSLVIMAGGSLPTRLAFQRVDDPTLGKNKLHLDIHTEGDLDDEVARWTEAGATSLGKRSAGDFSWVTLTDPEGKARKRSISSPGQTLSSTTIGRVTGQAEPR